ncbi:unnamed protein product [Tuber melanosporum]|uniref:(Perigord truffle) hypothetical protein n=1 Tax=Tuber melanosporum (strain Mel28) TaxID=656061 RepID=D5G643_TUBMM|nr:uncharacterized protein GSTUM_00001762001 [Tuber melanosporum]CAZ79986.1 unnamed protein product [Tuber melanosporum]
MQVSALMDEGRWLSFAEWVRLRDGLITEAWRDVLVGAIAGVSDCEGGEEDGIMCSRVITRICSHHPTSSHSRTRQQSFLFTLNPSRTYSKLRRAQPRPTLPHKPHLLFEGSLPIITMITGILPTKDLAMTREEFGRCFGVSDRGLVLSCRLRRCTRVLVGVVPHGGSPGDRVIGFAGYLLYLSTKT